LDAAPIDYSDFRRWGMSFSRRPRPHGPRPNTNSPSASMRMCWIGSRPTAGVSDAHQSYSSGRNGEHAPAPVAFHASAEKEHTVTRVEVGVTLQPSASKRAGCKSAFKDLIIRRNRGELVVRSVSCGRNRRNARRKEPALQKAGCSQDWMPHKYRLSNPIEHFPRGRE
jgi:hypothetical protein